jgi:hypothetical protein
MNVAGALALSISNGGAPDLELVKRLLVEAVSTQPALAIAGESEDDGGETDFYNATDGNSVEEVASRLIVEPRFAELVQPVALSDFIFSGSAGIPRLTRDEVDEFLAEVPERDPGYCRSWLELAPVDDDNTSWVAYPQSASTSIEFHLILPVAQDGHNTRLLALDPGLGVMTGKTQAPRTVQGTGCDPGVTGLGASLREVCLSANCSGLCKEHWKARNGRKRLTGCDC